MTYVREGNTETCGMIAVAMLPFCSVETAVTLTVVVFPRSVASISSVEDVGVTTDAEEEVSKVTDAEVEGARDTGVEDTSEDATCDVGVAVEGVAGDTIEVLPGVADDALGALLSVADDVLEVLPGVTEDALDENVNGEDCGTGRDDALAAVEADDTKTGETPTVDGSGTEEGEVDGTGTEDGTTIEDGMTTEKDAATEDGATAEDGATIEDGATAEEGAATEDGTTAEDGTTTEVSTLDSGAAETVDGVADADLTGTETEGTTAVTDDGCTSEADELSTGCCVVGTVGATVPTGASLDASMPVLTVVGSTIADIEGVATTDVGARLGPSLDGPEISGALAVGTTTSTREVGPAGTELAGLGGVRVPVVDEGKAEEEEAEAEADVADAGASRTFVVDGTALDSADADVLGSALGAGVSETALEGSALEVAAAELVGALVVGAEEAEESGALALADRTEEEGFASTECVEEDAVDEPGTSRIVEELEVTADTLDEEPGATEDEMVACDADSEDEEPGADLVDEDVGAEDGAASAEPECEADSAADDGVASGADVGISREDDGVESVVLVVLVGSATLLVAVADETDATVGGVTQFLKSSGGF
jgi:hypothetical protein